MTRSRQRSVGWLGALLGALIASCGPGPVAVLTGLEILVAEGDDQFGTGGQVLGTSLRAVVRTEATEEPQEGVAVRWVVESGTATILSAATTTTDETGSVEARVQLGAAPSEVSVRATLVNQRSASTTFALHSVDPPFLAGVSPPTGMAGDTVTLTGSNFIPDMAQNVVRFSGMRGAVVSASETQLRVVVPHCLPARGVEVGVQLGAIGSTTQPFTVTGGGVLTQMAVGEVIDTLDDAGLACYALEGGPGVQYLTLVYSASTVGAARHPFELTGLSSSGPLPAAPPSIAASATPSQGALAHDAQSRLDERLRAAEERLVADERSRIRVAPAPAAAPPGPAAVPTVGERRTFSVWAQGNEFEQVSAVARHVSAAAAIFVDDNAPAGGFDAADLQGLADRFDDVIHPEVTSHFGAESDLDGNERVIILFTPLVNSKTSPGSSGFIGGFFYGNDLLVGNQDSNQGEVFYALVPDPTGIHSDPRTKDAVLNVVPAVLAHEFQHMVQFNQRYLGLDAGQEALWLSEALAQMAEEVVARRYDQLGDAPSAELFRSGARARVVRYLADPGDVSLIVSTGQGSLAERGAGFLHLLYLTDQEGIDLLGRLATTTRRGVANVEAEVGGDWHRILADWWAATYLDGPGPEMGPRVYPELDLRSYLLPPFPLNPGALGPGSVTAEGDLWSSSAVYYIVTPDASGSMTMRLGGEAGGQSSPQSALRLRIIRIS